MEFLCPGVTVSPELYTLNIKSVNHDLHFQEVEVILDSEFQDNSCLYSEYTFLSESRFLSPEKLETLALKLEHATLVNDPGPQKRLRRGYIPFASHAIDRRYVGYETATGDASFVKSSKAKNSAESKLFRAEIAAANAGLEVNVSKIYIYPVQPLWVYMFRVQVRDLVSDPEDFISYTHLTVFIDGPNQDPIACQPKMEYTQQTMRELKFQFDHKEEYPLEFLCSVKVNPELNRVNVESVGKTLIFAEIEVVME